MYDHIAYFNGVEMWNTQRFVTYVSQHSATPFIKPGSAGCNCDISPWTGDTFAGYGRPSLDNAPWIDSSDPASYEFLGVGVENVTGAGDSMLQRDTAENGDGGTIGPAKFKPREITVDAVIAATTEAGLAYGKSWLSQWGLDSCGGSCIGGKLCMLAYCPSTCYEKTEGHPEGCFDAPHRDLLDAYMTSGPTEKKKFRINGGDGWAAQIEMIFTAGDPRIWRLPTVVTPGSLFTSEPGYIEPICPPVASTCIDDPNCPVPDNADLIPAGVAQCWTTVTQPWTLKAHLPAGQLPKLLEAVPIITLRGGSAGIRSTTLRFYADPNNRGCENLTGCELCSELNISFVPPDAELIIDARDKSILLHCRGGVIKPAGHLVSGLNRGVLTWPSLKCAPGMCVTAVAQGPLIGPIFPSLVVGVAPWEAMA
jgi:hypothetical protein